MSSVATTWAGRAKKPWGRAGKASMAMGVAAVAWLLRHPADTRLKLGETGVHYISPTQAMSEEQLKGFLEAVKADTGLQEKLKTAKDVDAVLEIAKAAGFVISADELQRDPKTELSDEELEELTGGASPAVVGVVASILYCVAGGVYIYDALGGD